MTTCGLCPTTNYDHMFVYLTTKYDHTWTDFDYRVTLLSQALTSAQLSFNKFLIKFMPLDHVKQSALYTHYTWLGKSFAEDRDCKCGKVVSAHWPVCALDTCLIFLSALRVLTVSIRR